ncbi:anhydro-N-acetylmuramic acid kinase [Niveibacterium sp. SC-1]|uniref:anhydro-N-acetylmuramic acid kinase n=1 Tax=Niveibacterium sp. SC-1 TaxID=3135646 RepID=UPI00311DB460
MNASTSSGRELYIGLMSGTSLDGVDALVADFSAAQPQCIATAYLPYPPDLRDALLALNEAGHDELRRAAELSVRLARLYAEATQTALARAALPPGSIRAIGCHGQTVRHRPQDGYSLQLNQPALLAELTGITVVADFRNRDIAAGGQGAPLVPAFHERVLRHESLHRVVANIGGIANLTDLAPGKPARGFDTGPGNMLLDAWATRQLGTRYDAGGNFAAQGQVLPALLEGLLRHPYFALPAPKSCGREEFHLGWLLPHLAGNENAADVQATLLELTARSIANVLAQECGGADELLVCGGGVHNEVLMQRLRALLPDTQVATTDTFGVSADFLEALAFAWLARQCLHGEPANLPEATGARGPRILGAIHPA